MSLVYDALRTPADTVGHLPPQAAASWRQSLVTHRRPALWLLAGVLVAGPLGFGLAQRAAGDRAGTVSGDGAALASGADRAPAPAALPVAASADAAAGNAAAPAVFVPVPVAVTAPLEPTPASAAPLPTVAAPAPPQPLVATSPDTAALHAGSSLPAAAAPVAASTVDATPPQAAAATLAPQAAPAAPAATAPAMASAAPATATTPAPAPRRDMQAGAGQIQLSVQRRDSRADGPAAIPQVAATGASADDGAAVRRAMAALHAAVGDDDGPAVAAAITQLQALLPAESLTLLRARAWAAHGGGDLAEADRLYRAILDRVPDDEHAGVNLALLDARRGEVDEARARLGRMAARNSRSTQVVQALAELDAAPR